MSTKRATKKSAVVEPVEEVAVEAPAKKTVARKSTKKVADAPEPVAAPTAVPAAAPAAESNTQPKQGEQQFETVEMHEPREDDQPQNKHNTLIAFLVVVTVTLFLGMMALLISTLPGGRALFYDIFHNKFFHMGQTFQWPPTLASVPPTVAQEYGFVFIIVIVTLLHCFKTGHNVDQLRLKFMNQAYIQDSMSKVDVAIKVHNRVGLVAGCYPDNGAGRFSDNLSWPAWYQINTAQRIYEDYVASLPLVTVLMLVAGLWFPLFTFLFGVIHLIGRFVYAWGYTVNVRSRSMGNFIINFAIFVLCLMALFGAMRFTDMLSSWDPKLVAARAAERAAEFARLAKENPTGAAFLNSIGSGAVAK